MKYVYYAFIVGVIYFVGNDIYQQTNKKGARSMRLACQKECKVFEKVYKEDLLEKAKLALKSGNYELDSSIKKAKFMKSTMFEYVQIEEVDQNVREAIAGHKQPDLHSNEKIQIEYYIYENDKDDPGKKTKKSKLFAGYLRFTMTLDAKKVYVIQADFMDLQGRDIKKSVDCA
ncbi:MAG: hypothetical protein U9R26_04850, partial [Campylobacterota bacterium]|nr:hypothetical protein [Campylobacterota bacterium]